MKVVSVVGKKKSGKTTLVEELIPLLKAKGTVGTIKNLPPVAYVDKEGTDTWRHRESGADVVVGITPKCSYRVLNSPQGLDQALEEMRISGVDYVLVEGFRRSSLPKISLGGLDASNILDIDPHDAEKSSIIEQIELLKNWRLPGETTKKDE